MPRRKVKSGSLADVSRGEKNGRSGAAVESMAVHPRVTGVSSLAATGGNASISIVTQGSLLVPKQSHKRYEITPDKSPKPQINSSSSESESDDERTKLISAIDTTKLSPGVNPSTMSNYELLRLRNIQRNEAKLASLGLVGLTTKKKKSPIAANKPKKKIQPAKNSPYVTNSHNIAWLLRYHELSEFRRKNGHIAVPKKTNVTLNGWITRQRKQYKDYKLGMKHSLDQEKIELLQELGVDKAWFGSGATRKKAVVKSKKQNRLDDSGDDIGSIDSYSDDEPYFFRDKKKSVQRELRGLQSPKWLDGHSSDDEPYFLTSTEKTKVRRKNEGVNGKQRNSSIRLMNKSKRKKVVDNFSEDDEYKLIRSVNKRKAMNTRNMRQLRHDLSGEDSDSDKSYFSRDDLISHIHSHSQRKNKRNLSDKRRGGKRSYVHYGTDESERKSYFDNCDSKPVCSARKRMSMSMSPSKRGGRMLVNEYSDDDVSSVEHQSTQSKVGSTTNASIFKRKKPTASPKLKRSVVKSSLEMIEAPVGKLVAHNATHPPAKRKGVVSDDSQRAVKRFRREQNFRRLTRKEMDSETSSTYSHCRSYTSSSISAASTQSSNLYYGSSKPMDEVLITKSTETVTTHNKRNDELKIMMVERHELMSQYKYLYADSMEEMQRMSELSRDIQSRQSLLIESGSTLFERIEGIEQLMLRANAQSALMRNGSLPSPEQLMIGARNIGLIENSVPKHEMLIPRKQTPMVTGGSRPLEVD